ncbi:MAG: hypothetical protein HC817_11755 [Saprospiraceae bacterium]|nr:hypothetical protein [Saprospiraceae bacterium]
MTIDIGNPVTYNNPELTKKMIPTLEGLAGEDNVMVTVPATGAEDFAKYQEKIPGFSISWAVCRRVKQLLK